MAATEIANAYIALYTRMPGVQNDIAKSLGGVDSGKLGEGVGSKFSAGIAGVVGGAMAAVTSKAIGLISNSINSAIARVDTINNFPKIMQNLGYSSDEAAASIQTMSTRLSGLPTALDSMAGMVQQLAPLTGGLSEATNLSLALNNALLAGGKSTDIQANAMEQYTQMLAVGKVDMAAWRSMVAAMPGQMDQLSASLLGAGNKSMDLYEAMKEGTVSFDEFNSAVLKLNEEGTGSFASFEQQARSATDGIATGQANLETAITRGLASLIGKFQPQITAMLAGITVAVNGAFGGISAAIDWMAENSEIAIPILSGLGAAIFAALVPAIWAAVTATWAFTVALLANPLTWIALAVGALVAAIVLLAMNWDTVTAAIGTAMTWLWETIIKPVVDAIAAAWNWLYTYAIQPVVTAIMLYIGLWAAVFQWLWDVAIKPAIDAIGVAFQWLWTSIIQPVVDWISNAINMFGLGMSILWAVYVKPAIDAIGAAFQWVWNSIIKPVADFISNAIHTVGDVIHAVFSGISDFIGSAFQSVLSVVRGPINALIGLINSVIDGLNSVSVTIPDWVPEVGGQTFGLSIPRIPRLADGAIIRAQPGGIIANIGEGRYDEAVVPLSPAVLSQFGGGQKFEQTVILSPESDPVIFGRKSGRAFVDSLVGVRT